MQWRPWAARVACGLILAGVVQPFYLRMLTPARAAFAGYVDGLAFRKTPGLREFMTAVHARTYDGDRIAIALPFATWNGGYAYAFTRSTYLLAGRITIPLVSPDDRSTRGNLRSANVVAAWHTSPAIDGFATVWSSADGALLRRTSP